MPDEMQPFKSAVITTAAAMAGVTPRQLRRWVSKGLRASDGKWVKCGGMLRNGELWTSTAAVREFLQLTRDIRRPAVKRDADGRRTASSIV